MTNKHRIQEMYFMEKNMPHVEILSQKLYSRIYKMNQD
nr:MAG TPA: hypothetical protein [Crassvirales sp.]